MPPNTAISSLGRFGDDVLDLYRRGVAETELPADELVARSLMPPGSAAGRDFSSLAPMLPELTAEACTGCMACVNVCPDSALYATAIPETALADAARTYFSGERADAEASEALAHFTETSKYGRQAVARGLESAKFGLFVDPTKCKGCAECVAVCPAAALRMTPKVADAGNGASTVDGARRQLDFFRSLPPTPEGYRSDAVLADLMLGEHAFGYVGGAGSCAGCGEATAIRMMVAATRQVHGPDSMGIVAATGCNSVYGATYPFNPYLVPWTNSLFENAPADALGIRARWDQDGHPERKLWVLGGDGAMYDIGFQSLSRVVASGADIKVLVLDTQVYSNTGGQASTATFGGQVTKLTAFGKAQHGKLERRKELGRILMSHGEVYVAQVSTAHVNHFYRAVMEANVYPGPAVLIAYTPCMPEHGIADDAGARSVKAAVDSRAFPLFTYDPRRGDSLAERLSLDGNPSVESDWHRLPDGTDFDFVAFARGEARFAPHFATDGTPSPEILASRDDRLSNWRMLQELARVGGHRSAGATGPPADFAETSTTLTEEEARAAAATCLQCADPTCVAACPLRVDIPRYLELVATGDFAAAAEVLARRNPMAAVTSRVCEQERQCEGSCKRATTEGAVPIRAIERFVAEWSANRTPPAAEGTGRGRVAIVGAGPAGLACAGELRRRGHDVTVFDAYDAAGGILRYGIPDYRLPDPVVDAEIAGLQRGGVRFELGVRVGESVSLDDLRKRYDATFLAIGLADSVLPGIPGQDLAGVVTANDFLERVNRPRGTDHPSARTVAVIGGGNVAIDAARSALRLGAEKVTIVYRRGRAQLPACSGEIHEAELEGVRFVFLASPVAIVGDAEGRVHALRCERMSLGEPDASGRPGVVSTGQEIELEAELVILALGSRVGPWLADAGSALAVDGSARPTVDGDRATSLEGVYAGGDLVRGAATVVEAIADGLRAAEAIDMRFALR